MIHSSGLNRAVLRAKTFIHNLSISPCPIPPTPTPLERFTAAGDAQSIEGMNSIIKYIATLAPWISWELLSSRVTIKKRCCSLGLKDSKSARDDFITDHADIHEDAKKWMNKNKNRFDCSHVDPNSEQCRFPLRLTKPLKQNDPHARCAAKALLNIQRQHPGDWSATSDIALVFKTVDVAGKFLKSDAWFMSLKHGAQIHVMPADIGQMGNKDSVSLRMPLSGCVLLSAVLATLHREICHPVPDPKGGSALKRLLDVQFCMVKCKWEHESTRTCSIDPECVLTSFGQTCRCGLPRRKPKKKPAGDDDDEEHAEHNDDTVDDDKLDEEAQKHLEQELIDGMVDDDNDIDNVDCDEEHDMKAAKKESAHAASWIKKEAETTPADELANKISDCIDNGDGLLHDEMAGTDAILNLELEQSLKDIDQFEERDVDHGEGGPIEPGQPAIPYVVPAPPPDEDAVRAALRSWAKSITSFTDDVLDFIKRPVCQTLAPRCCSLVCRPCQLVDAPEKTIGFMHWDSMVSTGDFSIGRVVTWEAAGKSGTTTRRKVLKFAGPHLKKDYQEEFSSGTSKILVSHIDAHNFRGTGDYRTGVPEPITQLRTLYEQLHGIRCEGDFEGDILEASSCSAAVSDLLSSIDRGPAPQCSVCKATFVHEASSGKRVRAYECALCGTCAHGACLESLVTTSDGSDNSRLSEALAEPQRILDAFASNDMLRTSMSEADAHVCCVWCRSFLLGSGDDESPFG
eukprot:9476165-Pyramimonas_sp.AAC.2